MKAFVFLFAASLTLFACKGTEETVEETVAVSGDSVRTSSENDLNGTWELNYISGSRIAFEGLYPDRRPTISFDIAGKKVNGNTSCNNYSGSVSVTNHHISLSGPLMMTKMACPGEGEAAYTGMLQKVTKWEITDGNTLSLLLEGVIVLRYTRK